MAPQFTFLRARAALSTEGVALSIVPDGQTEFAPFSYFAVFAKNERPDRMWGSHTLNFWLNGITIYKRQGTDKRRWTGISAEGDVVFVEEPPFQKDLGAGIESPDSKFYGRMEDICGVGAGLFACGDGGQIYQRRASGEWICLAPELLQPPGVPAAECDMFSAIAGPSETDVYVVGRFGKILHWDGSSVRQLASPTIGACADLRRERGAHLDLRRRVDAARRQSQGRIYARARHIGRPSFQFHDDLWRQALSREFARFDARALHLRGRALAQSRDGSPPELTDVKHTDAGAGVLWAVGLKDILHFDGKTWERIDFPLNPPIR